MRVVRTSSATHNGRKGRALTYADDAIFLIASGLASPDCAQVWPAREGGCPAGFRICASSSGLLLRSSRVVARSGQAEVAIRFAADWISASM